MTIFRKILTVAPMKQGRAWLGVGLLSLGLSLTAAAPGAARPEIASGDRLLDTGFDGCMARADAFIDQLGVQSDGGSIDRTGYFEDGTFRILCYGAGDESMVVIFASHDASIDVASNFVEMALDQMSEADEVGPATGSTNAPTAPNQLTSTSPAKPPVN